MKFTPKDATHPATYFVGGQALRLGPDDEYETDDAQMIEELKAHGQFKQVKAGKSEKATAGKGKS